MQWAYTSLYKYEITEQLANLSLRYNDRYYIRYEIHDLSGKDLGQLFPQPIVTHELGTSKSD